ncbi:alpha-L-rhamnosidase [Actinomadura hallensis]|uniref:alpha-L-rhamnosidase n=1 Tax=Actinomadura hallensis TaxID=337895 RepID=A0A543I871_9ACTN|nr:family 78 glycoside hydrolase catalytic domain [Actinomadura hallensis]TQM66796.1 alpha-L-rhamnosidase [Actinomadura hallensis]
MPLHSDEPPPRASLLRCEHLEEPLGIDVAAPAFGWTPSGPQRAYQVLVATDPELPAAGVGNVWDSGRVATDEVNGASYRGAPLASRRRYWWSVRLWGDGPEPGPFAPAASFETGLLDPADWEASWIAGGEGVSSPLLRTGFYVPGDVRRARAHVAALGCYELRLNGERVGDRVLDPATTSYDHDPELYDGDGKPARIPHPRVLYSTYDVTGLLESGANAAGLVLGHGWYSAEDDVGPGPLPRTPYGDRPRVLLQIEIETGDGRRSVVTTGEHWRTAPGPVTYNDYGHGERHDARREPPGWDAPGFDAASWTPAAVVDPPEARLTAQLVQPVRVIETLAPVRTRPGRDGSSIADFGQHFSGWTRVTVSGPAGSEVVLRHFGELGDGGEPDDDANMNAWLPARQTDTYVLKGEGEEVWEPRFTLHGFRYVEITTSAPETEVKGVEGRVVHSDLPVTGEFACSDPLLNRIHRNVLWTLRTSFQGFPQDAAERYERVGWVGDPGWAVEDYLYDFDAARFWLKWLDDLADTQLQDGRFPLICPIHWRGKIAMEAPEGYDVPDDFEHVMYWPYGAQPDFAMTSYPSIAWNLYRFYGDRTILERHYPGMRRGVEFLRSRSEGLILAEGLGDHMEPQPDGTCSVFPKRTPVELTSTAWFFAVTSMTADAAEAIGEDADAARYRELAADIRRAFNERFFDEAAASYATGSQTSRAMPLWFGIVPDEHRERALSGLIEQIGRDGGHLSTGTMGTAALQHVLTGEAAEVMYGIASRTTFPSWGHQVERGATTVWETWGGDPTFSRNMKLLATIGTFLYNDVAGLRPAAPGWRRILVRPSLTHRLAHARARVRTARGDAAIDWRADADGLHVSLTVPPAAEAEVRLPCGGLDDPRLTRDGVPVTDLRHDGDHLVLTVGGGTHRLHLAPEGTPEGTSEGTSEGTRP